MLDQINTREEAYTRWCAGDEMAFVKYAKTKGYKGGAMMRFIRQERSEARKEANAQLNKRG